MKKKKIKLCQYLYTELVMHASKLCIAKHILIIWVVLLMFCSEIESAYAIFHVLGDCHALLFRTLMLCLMRMKGDRSVRISCSVVLNHTLQICKKTQDELRSVGVNCTVSGAFKVPEI